MGRWGFRFTKTRMWKVNCPKCSLVTHSANCPKCPWCSLRGHVSHALELLHITVHEYWWFGITWLFLIGSQRVSFETSLTFFLFYRWRKNKVNKFCSPLDACMGRTLSFGWFWLPHIWNLYILFTRILKGLRQRLWDSTLVVHFGFFTYVHLFINNSNNNNIP